jgi:DNA-binding response OmpR family regulator
MAQILLVDAQQLVGERLKTLLVEEGHEVIWAQSLASAKQQIEHLSPDIVLFEIDLPDGNGLELLPVLREAAPRARRLVLSAVASLEDRINAFNAGADDFVSKPFVLAELLARIRAHVRRTDEANDRQIVIGALGLFPLSRVARLHGSLLTLAPREFDLLLLLARYSPEVVSRDSIALAIWKTTQRTISTDNAIDVHVGRLRKKVNLQGYSPLLVTMRGVGFKLIEPI